MSRLVSVNDGSEYDRRSAARAVDRWDDFPAAREPRLMVLLDDATKVERGFRTGDAKLAFIVGLIEAGADVPAEPVRLMQASHISPPTPDTPLRLTGAVLAETAFATDRGWQVLPAWRVDAEDTLGPIWVASEAARSRCWTPPTPPGEGSHILTSAALDPDGQGLAVEFTGGHEDHVSYGAEVVETAAAVTVIPVEHPVREFPPGTIVNTLGHPRDVHVRLHEPLGGRVLVNLDGTPVEVADPVT